jgi:hypothetical protein
VLWRGAHLIFEKRTEIGERRKGTVEGKESQFYCKLFWRYLSRNEAVF